MRLRKKQIESISENIVEDLLRESSIMCKDVEELKASIRKQIIEDLMIEDKLNDEVRKILDEHSSQIRQGSIEYHKMFRLVKEKLARERKIIL
ncbi:MAG: DUF507 family protein [bacterium]